MGSVLSVGFCVLSGWLPIQQIRLVRVFLVFSMLAQRGADWETIFILNTLLNI